MWVFFCALVCLCNRIRPGSDGHLQKTCSDHFFRAHIILILPADSSARKKPTPGMLSARPNTQIRNNFPTLTSGRRLSRNRRRVNGLKMSIMWERVGSVVCDYIVPFRSGPVRSGSSPANAGKVRPTYTMLRLPRSIILTRDCGVGVCAKYSQHHCNGLASDRTEVDATE